MSVRRSAPGSASLCPLSAQGDIVVARRAAPQWVVVAQQVPGESIVAETPCAQPVANRFLGLQVGADERAVALTSKSLVFFGDGGARLIVVVIWLRQQPLIDQRPVRLKFGVQLAAAPVADLQRLSQQPTRPCPGELTVGTR